MADPRISMVLHDGERVVARRPMKKELRERNLLDTTKTTFDTKTAQHKLGEQMKSIGGIEAEGDSGWQMYVALEKAGKVIQVGLPCITDESGNERFLDASNVKPGDLDSMVRHLPPDVEVLVVWRLDKGMTQDISVSPDSIITNVAGNATAGNGLASTGADYSMLDKKQCISCGGGASGKLELVVDIIEVRLFGGDKEDPIRMSTLMITPPEAFSWDVIPPPPPPPGAGSVPVLAPRFDASVSPEQTDFTIRLSWADSLKGAETQPSAPSPPITIAPEATLAQGQPVAFENPQASIIIYLRMAEEGPSSRPINVAMDRQPEPALEDRCPLMNASEFRLWLTIHGRRAASLQAASCPMETGAKPAERFAQHPAGAVRNSLRISLIRTTPEPETIMTSANPAGQRPMQSLHHGPSPHPKSDFGQKISRKERMIAEKRARGVRLQALPKAKILAHPEKIVPPPQPASRKYRKKESRRGKPHIPTPSGIPAEKVRSMKNSGARNKTTIRNADSQREIQEGKRKAGKAVRSAKRAEICQKVPGPRRDAHPIANARGKRKDRFFMGEMLGPHWKSRGRKFRMKKNSAP